MSLEEENKTKKDYESVFILGGYISGMLLLGLHTWITLKALFSDSKSITIYVNRYTVNSTVILSPSSSFGLYV